MDLRGDCIRVVHPLFQEEGSGSIPTSPLQLSIGEMDIRRCQRLNEAWHSVLPETHLGNLVGSKHSVGFGAEFDGKFYAVAMWSDPIAANRMKAEDAARSVELRRFAIADDAPKNTASRMIRVMLLLMRKKWPDLSRFVSYQAEDHHAGTIYKAAGWKADARSESSTWHATENRRKLQTTSAKVRWVLDLKPNARLTGPQRPAQE